MYGMYVVKNILSYILFRFKWKMWDRELSFKGNCVSGVIKWTQKIF